MTPRTARAGITFYTLVYEVVREVPRGRVATYGWVAAWLGRPRAARAVGYALAAALADDVPWQRIVNAQGTISVGGAAFRPEQQLRLLRREGIRFSKQASVDLSAYGFSPTRAQRKRWLSQGAALPLP